MLKIRTKLLAAAAVLSAVLLCGCDNIKLIPGHSSGFNIPDSSETELSPYPVTINGTEITKEIKKVISLTPAYTEIICEMGYESKLKGISSYCDYPKEITDRLPKVSGSEDPDINKIVQLAPDIVITATPIITKDKMFLESKGISVLTIPAPKSIAELKQIYEFFGLVFEGLFTGRESGDKAFAKAEAAIDKAVTDKKVKFVYITAALGAAGGDTLESDVLSLFGENLAKDSSGYSFDKEELLASQPDIIFLSDAFSVSDLKKDEVYKQLDAVEKGKIIILENKYFERPTTRLTELTDRIPSAIESIGSGPEPEDSENTGDE